MAPRHAAAAFSFILLPFSPQRAIGASAACRRHFAQSIQLSPSLPRLKAYAGFSSRREAFSAEVLTKEAGAAVDIDGLHCEA